jgi:hypothetical protein
MLSRKIKAAGHRTSADDGAVLLGRAAIISASRPQALAGGDEQKSGGAKRHEGSRLSGTGMRFMHRRARACNQMTGPEDSPQYASCVALQQNVQ